MLWLRFHLEFIFLSLPSSRNEIKPLDHGRLLTSDPSSYRSEFLSHRAFCITNVFTKTWHSYNTIISYRTLLVLIPLHHVVMAIISYSSFNISCVCERTSNFIVTSERRRHDNARHCPCVNLRPTTILGMDAKLVLVQPLELGTV